MPGLDGASVSRSGLFRSAKGLQVLPGVVRQNGYAAQAISMETFFMPELFHAIWMKIFRAKNSFRDHAVPWLVRDGRGKRAAPAGNRRKLRGCLHITRRVSFQAPLTCYGGCVTCNDLSRSAASRPAGLRTSPQPQTLDHISVRGNRNLRVDLLRVLSGIGAGLVMPRICGAARTVVRACAAPLNLEVLGPIRHDPKLAARVRCFPLDAAFPAI